MFDFIFYLCKKKKSIKIYSMLKKSLFVTLLSFCSVCILAQETDTAKVKKGYEFTDIKVLKTTPVKDQDRSGTCWSFSGIGLIENELLRMGKPEIDLSEMFVVRYCYLDKAIKYVRMHGEMNFSGGGGVSDVFYVMKKYGMVPEEVYNGLHYGTDSHKHGELDAVVKSYIETVVTNPNKKLTTAWIEGLNGILDAYLGKVPEKFVYKGKEYTPKTFAASLDIDPNDYVAITSFTHHPFNQPFVLEVPDNWLWGSFYNLSLDDMKTVLYNAIENDYSILWAADVSEKGFAWKKGYAIVPKDRPVKDKSGTEEAKWVKEAEKEKNETEGNELAEEKNITQEMRQEAFDNYETTDDHGMVIVGVAKDQNDRKYFKVKNSWNTDQIYEGYFYASEPYVLYKTTSFLVNKNAIPKSIKNNLNIK